MRVQTEEWRRFIPGIRMHKGKKTYFYNGEILVDPTIDREEDYDDHRFLIYDWEERNSWQVIMVLPGVEVIPEATFHGCKNVKVVIMSDDSVQTIEDCAFDYCESLEFVRLSRNLEHIGSNAFSVCDSLTSIFIPPSCEEIDDYAFYLSLELIIITVPQHTQLGHAVIADTALFFASSFDADVDDEEVNQWAKNINQGEEYELHRACSSFNPLVEIIYGIVKRQGLSTFQKKNQIGLTALDYLEANPYVENDIDQKALMKRYILEMMGEAI